MSGTTDITTHWRRARAASVAIAIVAAGFVWASPASSQSFTDRFKDFFSGGRSEPQRDAPSATEPQVDKSGLSCPFVQIRAGASTYAIGASGKDGATGNDVRYQATITRTARSCQIDAGQITAHIGVQGRVIAGPAGAPASVDVPLRIAVVQGGVGNEKVITTKVYRTTVAMTEDGSTPFTIVADDMVYPAPTVEIGDSYIFYIGFDPLAVKPEPRARSKRK